MANRSSYLRVRDRVSGREKADPGRSAYSITGLAGLTPLQMLPRLDGRILDLLPPFQLLMTLDQELSQRSALRFIVPSVRDVIFIFLFWSLLAGTLSNRPLADPDIGWHIRTGEQILATHSLPHKDSYSSTMQGQPWFAWEWLYDAVLGVLFRAAGLNGVVWLCATLVASTFLLLLGQLLRRGTGLFFAISLMLLSEAAAMIHLFARPHIVSWLLALLWFLALERWELQSAKVPRWIVWFFPASMVLWVNLHGEWVFGLAILGLYALAALVEWASAKDPLLAIRAGQRFRKMSWAWLGSAAATLFNPYGWRLHAHIYTYLGDRYLMNRIEEFRSPNFHGWAERCFLLIFLLTVFALAIRREKISLSRFLVALLAVYSGLFSSRNLPVSSMLLVLIIGPVLWEAFRSLANPGGWNWIRRGVGWIVAFSDRMSAQELQLRGHLWPVVSVVAALAICLQGGWVGSRHVLHAGFDPKAVPVAATDFLERENSAEPVFSPDSWGGYLIYRLYPKRQVVVDDRHDLYGSERVRHILFLMQAEPGWRNVLHDWHIRTVVLPSGSTLANLLRELPQDWRIVYEDRVAVIMEKREAADPQAQH